FALTLKKEFIKTIAILFIGVIAMLSFKRTTIFGFLMMTVSYYYMVLTMSKISSKKRFMIFSVGVVACFFLYQIFLFIEDKSGGHIIERLNSIQEDQGSGRLEIYAKIIDILSTSSVDELLFGRGYLSVLEYADVLAHNDFLQIIFDFGLIALVLYFVFFYQLLKYIGKIYKSRNISNINYPAFNAGIVAFIFLGMFNCFITSPVYYSTLMLYFGLAIGGFEREKIKNRLLKNEKKS
ncbi:MAG: O-antigen ligase domain-containing protein, partial [Flavobacterium sp.]|nr:O-antigen ligase domain-containing protein [Flavobacterium sp.]